MTYRITIEYDSNTRRVEIINDDRLTISEVNDMIDGAKINIENIFGDMEQRHTY